MQDGIDDHLNSWSKTFLQNQSKKLLKTMTNDLIKNVGVPLYFHSQNGV